MKRALSFILLLLVGGLELHAQLRFETVAPGAANTSFPCNGLQLLGPKAIARILIPTKDLGVEWALPGFDDQDWIRGVTGVGYELGSSPYQAGLILYHTLDKIDVVEKTVKDVSGPTLHTGTVVGALSMVPGRIAQGLDFKGDPVNHVRVAHHTELDPGAGNFTAAIWFKPTRGGSATTGLTFTESLVSKQALPSATAQNGAGWAIYRNQNGTFVQTVSGAGARTVPLGITAAGQWNHAVLVVNRATSSTHRLFEWQTHWRGRAIHRHPGADCQRRRFVRRPRPGGQVPVRRDAR